MSAQLSATPAARDGNEEATATDFLDLLGDEYTRRVLAAVTDTARSGREVMEVADVSKATAYRRLSTLEEAGLVESEMAYDPAGHHCEQFRAVVDSIDVELGEDGLSVAVETDERTPEKADGPGN